ncbi:hypothetical protein FXW78_21330 [Rhodococcus opacus]|nr:hypothetical protein [Rhodococcus opacus]
MIDTVLMLGAAVAAAVMVGAVLQRLSGTGLALVSAPLLTLLLGPQRGCCWSTSAASVRPH